MNRAKDFKRAITLAFELKKPFRLWHVLKDFLAAAEARVTAQQLEQQEDSDMHHSNGSTSEVSVPLYPILRTSYSLSAQSRKGQL